MNQNLDALPNISHSSSTPMSWNSETIGTAESVTTVRIITRLSPCFTTSDTYTMILVSVFKYENGAKLLTSSCGGHDITS